MWASASHSWTKTQLQPGGHGFRLLPKNFTDAWNDVSPEQSASQWIKEKLEEPGKDLRRKQYPQDEAREKVNAILDRMELKDPASRNKICDKVLDKASSRHRQWREAFRARKLARRVGAGVQKRREFGSFRRRAMSVPPCAPASCRSWIRWEH